MKPCPRRGIGCLLGMVISGLLGVAPARAAVRATAPPSGLEESFSPRRLGLVVGVEEYQDPALGQLEFTLEDASDMAALLDDPSIGAFDEVLLLGGEVTRDQFWQAWTDVSNAASSDDLVFIYFAGHGTLDLDRGTHLYLLFSDSDLSSPRSTGVALTDLEDELHDLSARHQVLVVDSCYSGSGRSAWSEGTREAVSQQRGPPAAPPARPLGRLDAELFAAHVQQPALEDPSLGHGVYTWYLLQALMGDGDLDEDGLVDVWEAHAYAVSGTIQHTAGVQTPWIRVTRVGSDGIYLAGDPQRRKSAEKALISGTDAFGSLLRIDGQPSSEVAALDPGWHRVEVDQDGQAVLSRAMYLRRGARVDMGRVMADRHTLALGAGLTGVTARQIGPPLFGHLEAWKWSQGGPGARIGAGALVAVGRGSVVGSDPFTMGHALLRGAWTWGGGFRLGPSLGAGVAWRAIHPTAQAGPLVAPGAHFERVFGSTWISADPSVWIVPLWDTGGSALERWQFSGVGELTFGWRR